MMVCKWMVLCEKTIQNEATGNISLIEVITSIEIPPPPTDKGSNIAFWPYEFKLVTYWQEQGDESENLKHRINIVTPSGKPVLEAPLPSAQQENVYGIFEFEGIPQPEEGSYEFRVQGYEPKSETWETLQFVNLQVEYMSLDTINHVSE